MARTLLSCLGLGLAAAALTASGGTAAPLLAGLAAGIAGNLGTDLYKALDRQVAERFLDGWSSIDENHHIDRALRLAQINGLRAVLARFNQTRSGDRDDRRHAVAEGFAERLKSFLAAETTTAQRAAFGEAGPLAEDEQAIRRAVLHALPPAFDRGLAARRATGDRTALIESLAGLRIAVEAAILAEIRLRTMAAGQDIPALFRSAFEGSGFPEGWFDLFIRDAAAQIKEGRDLERNWNAEQVALIKAIVESHDAILKRIDGRTERIEQSQQDLAAKMDAVLAQLARDKSVEIPPLRAILAKLGEAGIPDAEILPRLDAAADQLIELRKDLSRLRNDRPEFAAIRARALALIDRGELDAARAALAGGRATARAAREDLSRDEASFLADEARIDHLQLAYQAAAQKYAEAARLVRAFDRDGAWGYLWQQADELYDQGNEFGDNEALIQSIGVYHDALSLASRDRVPRDWAMTQNNLGNALRALGARQSGTARLEEAVAAYREALQEFTRDRVPLDWAMTQNNLGNALCALGERESGTARLEEAVAAYRNALQEWTRDRVPLDWATTQNNLGTALGTLGERESGTARLEEAVAAYRNALEEWTRDRVPLQWAMTQNNLGNALWALGARESGIARLEEAVAACRAALQEWTRERVPLDWAMTQNNLGNALCALGERESGTARLEEAVAAYRAALEEFTRERAPHYWAGTQENLERALRDLARRS